jgi:hypothetical protein
MRTPRRFGRLLSLVASVSVLAVVVWAPAAQADTPPVEHGTFSFTVNELDTGLCPFPIQVSGEVSGHFTDFFDDEGTITKSIVHLSNALTLSANGISVPLETGHWTEVFVFDESGNPITLISTGAIVHMRLPNGGTVGLDVGRVVRDLTTDEVVFRVGNFQLESGDTAAVCAVFS